MIETGAGEVLEDAPESPEDFSDQENVVILLNPENKEEIDNYKSKGFNCT